MSRKNISTDKNIRIDSRCIPNNREDPQSYFSNSPSWCFAKCDINSRWSITKSEFFEEIFPKLINFERRTWADIVSDKKHNHWIRCEDFSNAAKKRILEINCDYDELFSIRLTGEMRLFGYIENGVYYIIWFDPKHEICPSIKKHTLIFFIFKIICYNKPVQSVQDF